MVDSNQTSEEGLTLAVPQESLSDQKLRLEIAKAEAELQLQRSEMSAKLEKQQLELADLRRSAWTKPGTMIPILATLATLAFAQYQGVFETASKKLKNESDAIEIQNREVKLQRAALEAQVLKLQEERIAIEKSKASLEADRLTINGKLERSKTELASLRVEELRARKQAVEAETRAKQAYPAFLAQSLKQFVADANERCQGTKNVVSMSEVEDHYMEPEFFKSADSTFSPDVLPCLRSLLGDAAYLHDLSQADFERVRREIDSSGEQISRERSEAMRAYSDGAFNPSFPYLYRASREPREIPLNLYPPQDESEMRKLVEATRKMRLIEAFRSRVRSAIGSLSVAK